MSIHWQNLDTPAKIEAIKTVWQKGFSASDIAKHFDGASRGAVIGMYHRYSDKMNSHPLRTGSKGPRNQQWTGADKAKAIKALKSGVTCAQLGEMFGMSRNAASGRVLRDKELRAIGFSGKAGARVYSFGQAAPKIPVKPMKFAATEFDVASRNVPLMMLEARECRWPVNNAAPGEEHLFCGLEADGPYCAHHAARRILHGAKPA